jgi:hypothetical protein
MRYLCAICPALLIDGFCDMGNDTYITLARRSVWGKKRKPANAASWGFRPVMWCILILLIWRLLQVVYTNFVRVLWAGWTHNLILCFVPDCWHTSRARAPCVGPGVTGLLIRHRMFWNKGWYMDYPSLSCIYSYNSRTSWSTGKLLDPLGVEL